MKWKPMMKATLPFAAAAGLAVYLVAPAHATREQKAPFVDRNYAHRGLHKKDKSVPENSLAAFRRAVKAGYGVEMDVHITADDQLAVFHDDTLKRMIPGAPDGRIETFTLAELKQFRLLKTDEQIPTLEEALSVLAGRVPLILEIKSDQVRPAQQPSLRAHGGRSRAVYRPRLHRELRSLHPALVQKARSAVSARPARAEAGGF